MVAYPAIDNGSGGCGVSFSPVVSTQSGEGFHPQLLSCNYISQPGRLSVSHLLGVGTLSMGLGPALDMRSGYPD